MAGLDPSTFLILLGFKTWMPGTGPGMTIQSRLALGQNGAAMDE
jgi:hypothetical protein